MNVRAWPILGSERLKGSSLFGFRRDRVVSPRTGKEHDVYVLEAPDWVNVIAVTAKRHVVFVRQWRHGVREETLEIPGGVVEKGDSPETAARRELLEETGYTAELFLCLGFTFPNPAIQDNRCYTFVALNAAPHKDPQPDAMEDIEVVTYAISEIPGFVEQGKISHALIIAALWKFFLWTRDPGVSGVLSL
ncbi:NUDIX hydrolase [Desulfosoma caldarium]|uniref:GDP-mannose pyrophosphatase n=1 Tax=Desulfosoma caldarium TaxID=610254 RepID=A0A3N1VNH0_9BACT|nr:NUDIX hydrolase [Desulfosoma caldarium]ROR03490.1 ADP-ribose pyrophosphatase YjhB (NUDIX family) [Desulfosoma caldarium]